MNIKNFINEVHINSRNHGWWDNERPVEEIVALIHSEWSEALEEARAGKPMIWYACKEQPDGSGGICNPQDEHDCLNFGRVKECKYHGRKPEGIATELIDGCIRAFDYIGKKDAFFPDAASTLDELISSAPETEYRIPLPRLVANLYLKTSQAYTMLRNGHVDPEFDKRGFFILFETIALACAWIMDQGIDAEKLMLEKHEYNKSRPYKHGKKF